MTAAAELDHSYPGLDHSYLASTAELNSFALNSVAYIAGWVVKKVSATVNCPDCSEPLLPTAEDELPADTAKLINLKNIRGLFNLF